MKLFPRIVCILGSKCLWLCHSVTLSLCDSVTLSLCDSGTSLMSNNLSKWAPISTKIGMPILCKTCIWQKKYFCPNPNFSTRFWTPKIWTFGLKQLLMHEFYGHEISYPCFIWHAMQFVLSKNLQKMYSGLHVGVLRAF